MGMVVQHNMNALNAYNKLNTNVSGLKKSSEKLSSGYRINRAGDDAAGLAISEKMRSQIRGLTQAKRNSQDGISMIQTFEGAAQESHSILQRMKELASESANGTYQDDVDRDAIQLEFDQLNDELNQISDTDFNGVTALNGGVMADGTVANNTTVISTKPEIKYDQNGTPNSSVVYSENVNGTVDSSGNGSIVVNGVKVTLKGGKSVDDTGAAGDYEPDGDGSKFTVDAIAVDTGNPGKFTKADEAITAKEMFKIGDDDTTVTVYGKTYTITRDADGKVDALLDDEGQDSGLTLDDKETNGFSVETKYNLAADGTITNANGDAVGTVKLSNGVSTPDAYNHGANNMTYAKDITLQVGARSKDSVTFNFTYTTNGIGNLKSDLDISARGLGTDQLSLATQEDANAAIDKIDNAINKTSMVRATFGSIQNRLEHKIENLTVTNENLTEAESGIRDTDMASEMLNYTKYNVLQQAAQSMLAQANQQPQSILQLLG